jgi:peptidoglycan/LPS O-acetylase OafA/YrhL
MSSHRNGFIDQWRGISVLMVIVDHLLLFRVPQWLDAGGTGAGLIPRLQTKALWFVKLWSSNAGSIGVGIFFVISGYLITSLMQREEAQRGSISLGGFYVRRTFRIFPAMFVFLAAMWLLDKAGAMRIEAVDAFGLSLFLCNTAIVECGHLGHFWSLAVEEQFYLVWPTVMILSGRLRVPIALFTLAVAMIASVIPALRLQGWMNNGWAFACIATGVLYALSPNFRGMFIWTHRIPRWAFALTLVFFVPFAKVRWGVLEPIFVLTMPCLIVCAVLVRTEFRASIGARTLRQIGLISYSLYLWHCMFTWTPESYLSPWFAYASILAIGAACLSYRFVELPFIAIGKRFSHPLPQKQQLV